MGGLSQAFPPWSSIYWPLHFPLGQHPIALPQYLIKHGRGREGAFGSRLAPQRDFWKTSFLAPGGIPTEAMGVMGWGSQDGL